MDNIQKEKKKEKCYNLKVQIFDCLYKENESYQEMNTNDVKCLKFLNEFKKKCT